ncbi:MAG: YfcE family phosphodiesterase [Spirochaetia bacterium]|jgi:putative phosphoesterase|nr:YfcE family phosphodiesterase [Spirochaetia bacterium]
MRYACISDIHGNLPAFTAVIKDLSLQDIDGVIFLGDLVFLGLYPQECFDALEQLNPIICIKGNTDGNLEEVKTFTPSSEFEQELLDLILFCDDRLTSLAKETIASWPIARPLQDFLCCHGSPYSFKESLSDKGSLSHELKQKLSKEQAHIILAGHTHHSCDFSTMGKRIINPGAIGYAFDGDRRASYAILDGKKVEFRHVAYDWQEYLAELNAQIKKYPLLKSIAYAIEHARPMQFN